MVAARPETRYARADSKPTVPAPCGDRRKFRAIRPGAIAQEKICPARPSALWPSIVAIFQAARITGGDCAAPGSHILLIFGTGVSIAAATPLRLAIGLHLLGVALADIGELLLVHALDDGAVARPRRSAAHRWIVRIVGQRPRRQKRRAHRKRVTKQTSSHENLPLVLARRLFAQGDRPMQPLCDELRVCPPLQGGL